MMATMRIKEDCSYKSCTIRTKGSLKNKDKPNAEREEIHIELPNYIDANSDDLIGMSEWEDNRVILTDTDLRFKQSFKCRNSKPKDGWTIMLKDVETGVTITQYECPQILRFWGMSLVDTSMGKMVCACAPAQGLVALLDPSLENCIGAWYYGKGVSPTSLDGGTIYTEDNKHRILPYSIARNGRILASTDECCGLIIAPDLRTWSSAPLVDTDCRLVDLDARKASMGPNTKVVYQLGSKTEMGKKTPVYTIYDIVSDDVGNIAFTDCTRTEIGILRSKDGLQYSPSCGISLDKGSQPLGLSMLPNSDMIFTDHAKAGINFVSNTL